MTTIQAKANEVATDIAKTSSSLQTVALDPLTIMAIISIILELVKAFQECQKTPMEAWKATRKLGLLERWRLRRAIRRHLDYEEADAVLAKPLMAGMQAMTAKMTEEDVVAMYAEAGSATP